MKNKLKRNIEKFTLWGLIFLFSIISFYTSYIGLLKLSGATAENYVLQIFMAILIGMIQFSLVYSINAFYIKDLFKKYWTKTIALLLWYLTTMLMSVTFSFSFWYETFSAESYSQRSSELQLNKVKENLLNAKKSFISIENTLTRISEYSVTKLNKEKGWGGTCDQKVGAGESFYTWLRADDARYTKSYSEDIKGLVSQLDAEINQVSLYLETFDPKGDVLHFNRLVNDRIDQINSKFFANQTLKDLKEILTKRSGENRHHISVISRKTATTVIKSCIDRDFTIGANRVINRLNKLKVISRLNFFDMNNPQKIFARTARVLMAFLNPSYVIKETDKITNPTDITYDDTSAISFGFVMDFLILLLILLLSRPKKDEYYYPLLNEKIIIKGISSSIKATSYIKHGEFYKITMPLNFNLQMDSFLIYITDKPLEEFIEELRYKDEKILIISKEEYQNEIAKFAEDKTNRIIAFSVKEFSQLFSVKDSEKIFMNILSKNLSFKYLSPYQINDAVKNESNFFGRVETVRNIISSDRKNYLIIGARQLGKSSILEALKRRYENNPSVQSYSITLDENGNVLRAMSLVLGISKDSTLEEIEDAIRDNKKKVVFLIDEADKFIQYEKNRGYLITSVFRKLSQEGKATFVLAGFWTLYQYVTMDYQSPLKNFGELIRLEGLEEKACEELMIEPMKRLGIHYEDESIITRVIERCGYRANLIAIVCSKVLQNLDTNVITEKDIEDVFENGNLEDFLNDWGSLSSDENKNRIDRMIVYMSIKKETFKLGEIVNLFNKRNLKVDTESIAKSLNRLVLGYILYKSKGYYTYRVPLFKEFMLEDDIEYLLEGEVLQFE